MDGDVSNSVNQALPAVEHGNQWDQETVLLRVDTLESVSKDKYYLIIILFKASPANELHFLCGTKDSAQHKENIKKHDA